MKRAVRLAALAFALGATLSPIVGVAQTPAQLVPFEAFRIAGTLYYVGVRDSASYLVETEKGLILINPDWSSNLPLLRASVASLGFKFSDIRIILLSHAHADHASAAASIKEETGARYMVMDRDVIVVESGGRKDFRNNDPPDYYRQVEVDRVLKDWDRVELGGVNLTAHLTPGHTRGCTTWTMDVIDGSKRLHALVSCSLAVGPKVDLLRNPLYPDQAADFEQTFGLMKSLPVDLFLTAHGVDFQLEEKYQQLKRGGSTNPFIDPRGYADYVTRSELLFLEALKKQRSRVRQ